jgi:hypothetical protein
MAATKVTSARTHYKNSAHCFRRRSPGGEYGCEALCRGGNSTKGRALGNRGVLIAMVEPI